MTPLRVVTLPPGVTGAQALDFARAAANRGADLVELRTDLHSADAIDVTALARLTRLLVARRTPAPVPRAWQHAATLVDEPLESDATAGIVSLHAAAPMTTADVLGAWAHAPLGPQTILKHVEPLTSPADARRLLQTQRVLGERYGASRVTVLATGAIALPFRCVLAERNALDYLALDAAWQAAPGQRLLADAVRSASGTAEGSTGRLGILGCRIAHSRSPRIHPQPFDRLDLPEDVDVAAMLDALRPHYRGLAVTAPFKRAAARATGSALPAINTLVRRGDRWESGNTDVAGARAVLDALAARGAPVVALGDGGATEALKVASKGALRVVTRSGFSTNAPATTEVASPAVWTWPAHVAAPRGLRFAPGTPVAVIAYGPPARIIAARIREAGGQPVRLGPRWFIEQARAQRQLWSTAT